MRDQESMGASEGGRAAAHSEDSLQDRTSGLGTGTAPLATVELITLPAAPAATSVALSRMTPPVVAAAAAVMRLTCLE